MASSYTAAPAAKKAKTVPQGTPHFTDIDVSKISFDATPQGQEIKHATVKYGGERLAFQLEPVTGSLRVPFGIDDGSKFGGKASLNIAPFQGVCIQPRSGW